jgi:hypothetical protein
MKPECWLRGCARGANRCRLPVLRSFHLGSAVAGSMAARSRTGHDIAPRLRPQPLAGHTPCRCPPLPLSRSTSTVASAPSPTAVAWCVEQERAVSVAAAALWLPYPMLPGPPSWPPRLAPRHDPPLSRRPGSAAVQTARRALASTPGLFRPPAPTPAAQDNLAITPLIRRRVARIISCVAISHAPTTNASYWASVQWDVAGLFGAVGPARCRRRPALHGGREAARLGEGGRQPTPPRTYEGAQREVPAAASCAVGPLH